MDDAMTSCSSEKNKPYRDYLAFKDLLDDSELNDFM